MSNSAKTFVISGVCCATEEEVLKKRLDSSIGSAVYRYNSVTCELRTTSAVPAAEVAALVRQAGFNAREKREVVPEQSFLQRHGNALVTAVAAMLVLGGILAGDRSAASILLFVPAIVIGGSRIFWKALAALRMRVLDMNVLMTIAVIGAGAIGKWSEAAAVVVLFSVALMLENYSTARSRRAVKSLLTLTPERASVIRGDREETIDAVKAVPGDLIVVRPGERVPLDGVVTDGSSTVNEAAITGESMPVTKEPGATVLAGSINERGVLRLTVSRCYEETTLAHIVHLIEESEHQRAPVQDFIDRFARIYTPVVLMLALLVATVPPLIFLQPAGECIYRALVLLVIACPCALVISTPVTLVSALTNAARRGILIKGGKHIENLSRVNAIAFDKTGTLTEGRPRLTDVISVNSLSREEILQIVAALEYRSEHHLATAVLEEATRMGIDYASVDVTRFEALPGRGIQAVVGGRTLFLGNERLGQEHGFFDTPVADRVREFLLEGKTPMILGREGEPISVLGVRDTARSHGRAMVEQLRRQGIKRICLLSGDQQGAVDVLAEELGIDDTYARLLPGEKVSAVQEMKRDYQYVAMVGDGINDAPALLASTVGIAMGVAGADAALETADVVLMSDNLSRLPHLFGLSKTAMRIIRQNIALALGIKSVFLILSMTGFSTLWMALLADDGAALAVILNGLRMLTFEEPR